jgi:hypothetical protein
MAHARAAIRDALVAALTGLATTGSNCKGEWPYATAPAGLPALRIYLPSEDRDDDLSDLGSKTGRSVTAVIVGHAEGVLVDETLDTIAAEVETALAASPTLGGLVKLILYQGTTIDISGEAKKRAGEIRISFAIRYRTPSTDPTEAVS